jgi:inositol hexakisphosphate/diphosphoinositol-pentakisphosphate kinase
MAKKVNSKPMEEILTRLKSYNFFEVIVFPQDMIVNSPIEEWPRVECLISFYSKDFPLKKAQQYAAEYNPFLINDLEKQWDIMDRTKVYQTLREAGIELPRYAIKMHHGTEKFVEQDDQIEIDGQVFTKPFVEKPINADDHNIYIYFPTSAGGGSQRLFRKVTLN